MPLALPSTHKDGGCTVDIAYCGRRLAGGLALVRVRVPSFASPVDALSLPCRLHPPRLSAQWHPAIADTTRCVDGGRRKPFILTLQSPLTTFISHRELAFSCSLYIIARTVTTTEVPKHQPYHPERGGPVHYSQSSNHKRTQHGSRTPSPIFIVFRFRFQIEWSTSPSVDCYYLGF